MLYILEYTRFIGRNFDDTGLHDYCKKNKINGIFYFIKRIQPKQIQRSVYKTTTGAVTIALKSTSWLLEVCKNTYLVQRNENKKSCLSFKINRQIRFKFKPL